VNDFLGKNCPYIAGAISFYALFSFFPLVLAIISVVGFISGSEASQTELAKDIAAVVPVETEYVSKTIEGVVRTRAITGIAAFFGLLWAASAAFGAMRKGINAAWGVKKTRPFLKERLIDITLVLGAGVVVMVLLFVSPIMAFIRELVGLFVSNGEVAGEPFWRVAERVTTPLLSFATFLILYRFIPNTRVRVSDVWVVALLASAAFYGAQWGFVWYIKKVPVYNVVYGSVGAIMALLTWVYVSAIILLFGALASSRYAGYAARVRDARGFKLLWTGVSRVRLRVVAATGA
jgi:membrane protein